jgi:hypothetical protein
VGDLSDHFVDAQSAGQASASEKWDQDRARRSLDELFTLTRQYRSSKAYSELLKFVARFRFYAPSHAHSGARCDLRVAPPHRWLREYSRRIKAGAHPLVILQPMGPVMFVFDVSDTEPEHNAPSLPPEVQNPFEF